MRSDSLQYKFAFHAKCWNLQNFSRYVYVAQKMPEWLGMLVIFRYITWIVTCSVFVVSALAWYFIGRRTSERRPHTQFALCVLNSWAVTICISVPNRPERSALRIFFIALALYSINLTTIYTSKLISVFTNPPYEDQIDTIDEIIESKLPIGKSLVETMACQIFLSIKYVAYNILDILGNFVQRTIL